MNSYGRLILLSLLVLFITSVKAQNYKILDDQFSNSTVLPRHYYGFSLYDLDSNKFVYGVRDNQHFTPASNTKVFTLFSSLVNIKDSIPGIRYIEKGDSLIFWGTGDPTFLHPKLDTRIVYNFLKNTNKKLFYSPELSSESVYRNGWSIEDYEESYQPEIATFPIYGNLVRFVADGKGVKTFPKYFERFVGIRERSSRYFNVTRKQNENRFELTNLNVPKGYSTSKPFIYSDSLFVSLLQDTLRKEVVLLQNYAKPTTARTLYSASRDVVLRAMMLPSDNFLAEHLTMLASSNKYDSFYTDSLRVEMNDNYYKNFLDTIELRDGSGLSTYNKVSPRSLVEVLLKIKEAVPEESQRFLFFPAGGVDGTLRNAYTLDQGVPFVWAKTGTLNRVHCQSGYIITRSGKRYIFSFLNNNYMTSTAAVRREMVKIVTFIRQNY